MTKEAKKENLCVTNALEVDGRPEPATLIQGHAAGISRRQVLAAGGLGLTGLFGSGEADAATPRLPRPRLPSLSNIGDVGSMIRGQGLQRPGVVYEVRHPNVFPLGGYVPDQSAVNQMLATLMKRLTRESTTTNAWAKIFGSGDKVGILVDAEGNAATTTRKPLVMAVLRNLLLAGVSANDIIVWCTFGRQMPGIGFNLNWRNQGIKFLGADQMGYDQQHPFKMGGGGGMFGSQYHLSKIVSQACTHIINIATLEDHPILGCRLCLAQQAISSISKGQVFERYWGGAKGIGEVAAWSIVQQRFVLHLIDGLGGQYNGALSPWHPQLLLGGTDPVAVDRMGFATIDSQRRRAGVPVITGTRRTPVHINHAALHGAGKANIQQIQHIKIMLK